MSIGTKKDILETTKHQVDSMHFRCWSPTLITPYIQVDWIRPVYLVKLPNNLQTIVTNTLPARHPDTQPTNKSSTQLDLRLASLEGSFNEAETIPS